MKFNKSLTPVLGLTFAVLSALIYWKFINIPKVEFGAVGEGTSKWLTISLGYLITLLGVIFGSFYRNLQEKKHKGQIYIKNKLSFIKKVFSTIDFWISVCASPLVYMIIFNSIKESSISSLILIAFENGFFITVIMDKLVASKKMKNQALVDG